MCQILERSASRFSASTLVEFLPAYQAIYVDEDSKLITTVVKNLERMIVDLPIKQVILALNRLRKFKLSVPIALTDKEKAQCKLLVLKILQTADVKSLTDCLYYAHSLKLSATLENDIIDRLLKLQDQWTKDDPLSIIRVFETHQSLDSRHLALLLQRVVNRCTELAPHSLPRELVYVLRAIETMLRVKLDCVSQLCKIAAERAVRERWNYNLLKSLAESYSKIGYSNETFLESF